MDLADVTAEKAADVFCFLYEDPLFISEAILNLYLVFSLRFSIVYFVVVTVLYALYLPPL